MADFEKSIPAINKLVFTIGGFERDYETRTLTLDGEHLYMNIAHSFNPTPSDIHTEPDYPVSKEELLDGLRKLNISKWRRSYDNRDILDGTQWELNIYFSDGHRPIRIWGSNAYPDNFNKFLALLGAEPDEEYEVSIP